MGRIEELADLIPKWLGKPEDQIVEEATSYLLETNGAVDPYYFWIEDGQLFSPITLAPVTDSIEKNSPLGRTEFGALLAIEDWAVKNEKGTAFWISPPGKYAAAKMIVSEIVIEDGLKKLLNRSILLDLTEEECFGLACALAEYSERDYYFWNIDQVRGNPIFLDLEGAGWIGLVEKLIDSPSLAQAYDLGLKNQAFGNNQTSCPPGLSNNHKPTAFELFFASGEKKILPCKCPKCGQCVKAEIYDGHIHCPACGASERWTIDSPQREVN